MCIFALDRRCKLFVAFKKTYETEKKWSAQKSSATTSNYHRQQLEQMFTCNLSFNRIGAYFSFVFGECWVVIYYTHDLSFNWIFLSAWKRFHIGKYFTRGRAEVFYLYGGRSSKFALDTTSFYVITSHQISFIQLLSFYQQIANFPLDNGKWQQKNSFYIYQ